MLVVTNTIKLEYGWDYIDKRMNVRWMGTCCNLLDSNNKTTDTCLVDVAQLLGEPRKSLSYDICVLALANIIVFLNIILRIWYILILSSVNKIWSFEIILWWFIRGRLPFLLYSFRSWVVSVFPYILSRLTSSQLKTVFSHNLCSKDVSNLSNIHKKPLSP
jgi:hypothetical protein